MPAGSPAVNAIRGTGNLIVIWELKTGIRREQFYSITNGMILKNTRNKLRKAVSPQKTQVQANSQRAIKLKIAQKDERFTPA